MSFLSELKRRNVFKVAVAYIIVAWLLLQVSDTLVPALYLPEWFNSGVAFLLIIGFPVALVFAWAFELTPEGLKKEKEVDKAKSITAATGQKLNYTIIALLAAALMYFAWEKFTSKPDHEADKRQIASTDVQTDTGGISGLPQPDKKSIAVIPFQNRSANEEDAAFFSDGVHDELLTNLSKIEDLKVISRTSVMAYRDTTKNMRQIGEELGVANILEGGVQRAGDAVRINIQLIDAATDEHLWAEVYNRQLTAENVFAIQAEIARAIANALEATLSPREQALLAKAPTANLAAYDSLLMASQLLDRGNWQSLLDAQTYLQNAIDMDPGYVQAYALLARTYSDLYSTGATTLQETSAAWEQAIQTALSLDENHAGAHAAQAQFLWASGLEGVAENFEKARQLEPANVDIMVMYGEYLYKNDHPNQALLLYETARELDPVSVPVLFGLARVHQARGEHVKALEIFARIRQINPSSTIGYGPAAGVYMAMGNRVMATELLLRAISLDPDDSDLSNWVAFSYIDFNDLARARDLLSWIENNQKNNPMTRAGMALLNIYQGELPALEAYAQQALNDRLQARWGSDVIQFRALLIWALDQDQAGNALKTIELIYPELFQTTPAVNAGNVMQAIDTARLLLQQNSNSLAEKLLRSAIALFAKPYAATDIWHAPGKAQALALLGEKQAALEELRQQVDQGWRHLWRLNTELNPNFELLQKDAEFQAIVATLRDDMASQYEQFKIMESSVKIQLPQGLPTP